MSVQKYILSKDETGFTILSNKVLQNYKDIEALGLWVYVASRPQNWVFYKEELRKHFKMGRERLQKIINSLKEHGLITITMVREPDGKFAHASFHVHNGDDFKIPQKPLQDVACEESVQPCTEKPLTVSQSLDTVDYKEREKKKEINKDISNINSATVVAHVRNDATFDEFWKVYPVKKNKERAKRIWDREKFGIIATLICCDVMNRVAKEPQWQQKQYIPHPSTYLCNKLWNDEITQDDSQPRKSSGKSSSFDAYQAELKKQNRGTTYEHGAISQ